MSENGNGDGHATPEDLEALRAEVRKHYKPPHPDELFARIRASAHVRRVLARDKAKAEK